MGLCGPLSPCSSGIRGYEFDLDRLSRTFVDKLTEIPLWKALAADLAEPTGITRKEIDLTVMSWGLPEPWRGILGCERCLNRYILNRFFFLVQPLGIISEQQQKEPQWTASPHSSVKDYFYCENSYHCTFEPPEGDMKA